MNFIEIKGTKQYDLTLVGVSGTNLKHNLISKIKQKITLIDSEKTYYCYLGTTNNLNQIGLYKLFVNLAKTKQQFANNINIDIASFCNENIKEEKALQIIYEALLFGSHQAYSLKTTNNKKNAITIKYNLVSTVNLPSFTSEKQILIASEAVNTTRDLQDTPPDLLTPTIFAEKISAACQKVSNLKVTILDKKAIAAAKMNLLLAVSAGSYEEPRVVILEYYGDPDNKADVIGLVGKGITFDSGGYSLKPSNFMKGMKRDMSGAAIVCNAAIAAAKLNLKVNFITVACLTENRIGGKATLVDTVVTSMNGKTVEIDNTDAEGRLVLADGITYAIRKGKASKIIDFATLTGAILYALGDYMTGAFSNNDELYDEFLKATKLTNEEIWRMPIHEQNVINMKNSEVADLSNISKTTNGSSSNAAAFLQEFVENKPFLHLDIAGTAGFNDKSGSGVMVKTIIQYLKNHQK